MESNEISILVEEYSNMIMRIAYQNSFNKEDSQDIVQEVFIKLLNHIESFKDKKEYIKPWLIRVTINLTKDYNKKVWNRKVDLTEEELENYSVEPEEKWVFRELSKLKPMDRNILYLYYYEGYKIHEIATIMNLKENTVSSNLTRARSKLKNILEEGSEIDV